MDCQVGAGRARVVQLETHFSERVPAFPPRNRAPVLMKRATNGVHWHRKLGSFPTYCAVVLILAAAADTLGVRRNHASRLLGAQGPRSLASKPHLAVAEFTEFLLQLGLIVGATR